MTKKSRSPAKKANSFGMGRIIFYSIALIVACCAVAVVLFETEAGQELVAKVRGKKSSSTRAGAKAKFTETKPSEGKANKESGKSKKTEQATSAESALPRAESVLSSDKDTSANPSDNSNERTSSGSRNEESVAGESVTETPSDGHVSSEDDREAREFPPNTVSGDTNNNKEDWEIIDEEIDKDEPVDERDKPVEQQDKPAVEQEIPVEQQEKPVEEQDKPVVEMEKPVEEQDKEHEKPVEEPVFVENAEPGPESEVQPVVEEAEVELDERGQEEFLEEKEISSNDEENLNVVPEEISENQERQQEENMDKKDVEQVDGSKEEQEETISVGDSLAELEKKRSERLHAKQEERYDPIPEPEGPPIDQSPVNARRGLRGDYGGKDCKDEDKNCAGWAKLGECNKNAAWMHVNCKKSCHVCSCSDNYIKCVQWAETGECKKNPEWMKKNCMKSCRQC